jgi:hypothetical protein
VRYLIRGDLGPGSFLLTGTIGGAAVFKSTRTLTTYNNGGTSSYSFYTISKSADYGGPALGLTAEWRL